MGVSGSGQFVTSSEGSFPAPTLYCAREKKKHDPNFKGPIHRRGCTDIIFCILFAAYMVFMIVIGALAYINGNPKRLLYPTDSAGKICGMDVPNKPYLFFFDLTQCLTKGTLNPVTYAKRGLSCPTPQVCVSKCPSVNGLGATVDFKDMICLSGVTVTNKTTMTEKLDLVKKGKCAAYYLQAKPVFYRCLPSVVSSTIDALKLKNKENVTVTAMRVSASEQALTTLMNLQNSGMKVLDELKAVYKWIIVGFVLAMIISLLYIVLSRWITFPLVILTSLALLGLTVFGIYFCFKKYKYLSDSGTSKDIVWKFSFNLSNFTQSKNTWLTFGIVLLVMFIILFLIMAFLYSRVRIACALIAETSRALCSMLSTLFFPVIIWVFQFAWFAWFLVVLLYLASNGVKQYRVVNAEPNRMANDSACDPKTFYLTYPNTTASCIFSKYKESNYLLQLQIAHIFGWLWGCNFLIALGECTLAGAFASYYWAWSKPKDIPTFPVFTSLCRAISCHTGSLALGALIIAIVKLIRVTLEYIHRKLKESVDNPVANFIMKCLKCCFWCLEKCLRFLNKNAYIMIAIYGKNFCSSAKEAFWLLARNPARLITINGVTGFILFLGKLFVVGIIGVAGFFWYHKYNANLPDKLNYSAVPLLISVIGAYIVAIIFFNVYDMGIDTIFLCFLEDLERHDGSEEKPYFMTDSLKNIMDVKNTPTETTPIADE
eukprot:gene15860-17458_t